MLCGQPRQCIQIFETEYRPPVWTSKTNDNLSLLTISIGTLAVGENVVEELDECIGKQSRGQSGKMSLGRCNCNQSHWSEEMHSWSKMTKQPEQFAKYLVAVAS